jgi:hypothetical protein
MDGLLSRMVGAVGHGDEAMPIELVAAQSEQDRRAALAQNRARWALRELTANLIRVARGAGKPYDVEVQAARFLEACDEYRAATSHGLPTDAVHDMLRVRQYAPEDRARTDEQNAWDSGEENMVAGALQIAASRLVGQGTQEARGQSEMFEGLRIIERLREERRRKWEAPAPQIRHAPTRPGRKGPKPDL